MASCGLYSYGIYSYGLYSHGLYSHGLYGHGLGSYGLCSYGLYSYGLYSYGLYSYGRCWQGLIVELDGEFYIYESVPGSNVHFLTLEQLILYPDFFCRPKLHRP